MLCVTGVWIEAHTDTFCLLVTVLFGPTAVLHELLLVFRYGKSNIHIQLYVHVHTQQRSRHYFGFKVCAIERIIFGVQLVLLGESQWEQLNLIHNNTKHLMLDEFSTCMIGLFLTKEKECFGFFSAKSSSKHNELKHFLLVLWSAGLMPYNYICVQTGSLLSEISSVKDVMTTTTMLKLATMAVVALVPGIIFRKHKKTLNKKVWSYRVGDFFPINMQ